MLGELNKGAPCSASVAPLCGIDGQDPGAEQERPLFCCTGRLLLCWTGRLLFSACAPGDLGKGAPSLMPGAGDAEHGAPPVQSGFLPMPA